MDSLSHEVAERGIDGALAGDAGEAGEGGGLDGQREVAFAATVMPGVADVSVALVLKIEANGVKRLFQSVDHLARDGARSRGGGSIGHRPYIIGLKQ